MSRWRLWSAWVAANAVGELLGLGTVFAIGFAIYRFFGEPSTPGGYVALFALVVVLAAWEGAVVGAAQWAILRRHLPGIARSGWIGATVLGAVVAWILGMIPSTLASAGASEAPPPEPGPLLQMVLAVAMGAAAGSVLSVAQWWILRRRAVGAGWWPIANATAWAAAMPWIFFLVGTTVAETAAIGGWLAFLGGLAVAGGIAGAIHGAFLVTVVRPR